MTLLVALRTAIMAPLHTDTQYLFFGLLVTKLVLFTTAFCLELLGPDGWDGTTWRDWVPLVQNEGKIRLEDSEGSGEEKLQPECPRLRANIFQILTFSWLTPMYARLSCD